MRRDVTTPAGTVHRLTLDSRLDTSVPDVSWYQVRGHGRNGHGLKRWGQTPAVSATAPGDAAFGNVPVLGTRPWP